MSRRNKNTEPRIITPINDRLILDVRTNQNIIVTRSGLDHMTRVTTVKGIDVKVEQLLLLDYLAWKCDAVRKNLGDEPEDIKVSKNGDGEVTHYMVTVSNKDLKTFINTSSNNDNLHDDLCSDKLMIRRGSNSDVLARAKAIYDFITGTYTHYINLDKRKETGGVLVSKCEFNFNSTTKYCKDEKGNLALCEEWSDISSVTFTVDAQMLNDFYPINTDDHYALASFKNLVCLNSVNAYKIYKYALLWKHQLMAEGAVRTGTLDTVKKFFGWEDMSNSNVIKTFKTAISTINNHTSIVKDFKGLELDFEVVEDEGGYHKAQYIILKAKPSDMYKIYNSPKKPDKFVYRGGEEEFYEHFKELNERYFGVSYNQKDVDVIPHVHSYCAKNKVTVRELDNRLEDLFYNWTHNGYKGDNEFMSGRIFKYSDTINNILAGKRKKPYVRNSRY